MLLNKKIWVIILILMTTSFTVQAHFIERNRDTRMPPDTLTYVITEPEDMQFLYETDDYKFYFRDSRDVFAIHDKRNGYTWKTGLDIEFNNEINRQCNALLDDINAEEINPTDDEILAICQDRENRMNTTYQGIGNSLLSMEYYDISRTIRTTSSAAEQSARSTLFMVNNDPSKYRLDVTFDVIDVMVSVRIDLSNDGMSYEIRDEEITGMDTDRIAGFILSPFFGASGGMLNKFNLDTMSYDSDPTPKPEIPGYFFVPDGSGALIRFNQYETSLHTYSGEVYGSDASQNMYHFSREAGFVPLKTPVMPVFGVAHGNRQAAFVAYATSGAEHLNIIASPTGNRTPYHYIYARFNYNSIYQQVYNQAGAGFLTLRDERNRFDAKLHYSFLANDGTQDGMPADYVGMALKYREHLIDTGVLTPRTPSYDDIPIRLDFLMADAMNALVGNQDVVVTDIHQVESILTQLHDDGITNINSGLLGFQSGGVTLGRVGRPNFSRSIGTAGQFRSAIQNLGELGIDVSLAQDYARINREQMNLSGNASKHVNSWYNVLYMLSDVGPVNETYYARPARIADWIYQHERATRSLGVKSITYQGVGELLYSDYGRTVFSTTDVIDLYQGVFEDISEVYMVNAVSPHQYIWHYVDRFLQTPMFNSQHLIQTDTVPFLQIVLNHTMELYATYSNFSFYTQEDIIRMIDYNVYPAFILTHDPAYRLLSTNSSDLYSTEFSLYEPLIHNVYDQVNSALRQVLGAQWVDRMVVEPGVVANFYDNGMMIVINYTQEVKTYNATTIGPVSYRVVNQ